MSKKLRNPHNAPLNNDTATARQPFALQRPDGTTVLDEIIALSDAANDLGVHPARFYAAANRIRVPVPKVGERRFVARFQIAAIANELTRQLIETRRTVT